MARDLLEMTSLQNGVERVTRKGIAAGHNYQLFNIRNSTVWNVEVASFGRVAVKQFTSQEGGKAMPAYFHANTYQNLGSISQINSNSSTHRDARAKIMLDKKPIQNGLVDMYDVIGDQFDAGWPIYHDNLSHEKGEHSDWTLCTLSVDVMGITNPRSNSGGPLLHIFLENPKNHDPILTVHLSTWFESFEKKKKKEKKEKKAEL